MGKDSGKASWRRCWELMADVVLQNEDWFPKLGCEAWQRRSIPGHGKDTPSSPPSTKQEANIA